MYGHNFKAHTHIRTQALGYLLNINCIYMYLLIITSRALQSDLIKYVISNYKNGQLLFNMSF